MHMHRHCASAWTLVLLLSLTPMLAAALPGNTESTRAPERDILVATTPLTIADVLTNQHLAWRRAGTLANPGLTRNAVWVRFVVGPGDMARVLTIDNPILSQVDLYITDNTRLLAHARFGAALPFAGRMFRDDTDFTYEVPSASVPLTVFIEARSEGSLRVVPLLRTSLAYREHVTVTALGRGIYYGTLVVMVIYNIGLALSLRDIAYTFYVGYAASILLLVVTLDGTGYEYLWPSSPEWQATGLIFAIGMCTGFLQLFARDFLRVPAPSRLHAAMTIVAGLCFLHALAPLFYQGQLNYWAAIAIGAITSASLFIAGARSWRSGFAPARLYFLAYICMFSGAAVFLWREFSSGADSFFTQHSLQLGTTADVVLLSLALGTRIRTERTERERERADADALSVRLEDMQREQELALKERTLQDSLQRARQLQVLGQMAGGFGHEFNNILTSMVGFAELAIERAKESRDESMRRFLTEIQSGGRRAAELVDQLLTYSGGNRRDTSEVALSTITERALAILRPTLATQHRLDWIPPATNAIAHVDPDRLQQAIINLCLNARDSMPDRGLITVRLLRETYDGANCASCLAEMHGSWHVIQVTDTGIGIQGDIASIFMPFHSTRPGDGGGLGLAVVHGVAHEYGGHLLVRESPGGGTEIDFCLPT